MCANLKRGGYPYAVARYRLKLTTQRNSGKLVFARSGNPDPMTPELRSIVKPNYITLYALRTNYAEISQPVDK